MKVARVCGIRIFSSMIAIHSYVRGGIHCVSFITENGEFLRAKESSYKSEESANYVRLFDKKYMSKKEARVLWDTLNRAEYEWI